MTDSEQFIWRAMCRAHWFDEGCHQALVDGCVKAFIYLSSGQEAIAAAVACAFRDRKVNLFCQHRNHSAYLSFGGDPMKLRDELQGLETGTTRGIGGDPCHAFDGEQAKMWGHSGLVADHVPIAVGMAFATREWSVCFFGDSAVEEDIFWPAFGFAVTHKLPVVFLEEDNGLSVITETAKRRSWKSADVAEGFVRSWKTTDDLDVRELDDDDPEHIYLVLRHMISRRLPPFFLSVKTCRKYRHVGPGSDGPMKWDRMAMVRERVGEAGVEIEQAAKREAEKLWAIR